MAVINYKDLKIITPKDRIKICLKRPRLIPIMIKGAFKKKKTDEFLRDLMRENTLTGTKEADNDRC